MESDINVPQLTVETETIRRNSSSENCISSETDGAIVSQNSSTKSVSDKCSELSHKRTDSDSKFGFMENISLDLSVHERTTNASSEAPENSSSLPPDLKNEETFETEAGVDSKGTTIYLSKYFGKNPSDSGKDSDFFDTITGSSVCEKTTSVSADQHEIENVTKDILNVETEEVVPTPLSKFFSQDKSGVDKDGKAFFDKISEKSADALPQIHQPILSPPYEEDFLNSPVTNSEIEESWIPSENTRLVLVSIHTSMSPVIPNKDQLTMPRLIMTDEMKDPVKELLLECHSPKADMRRVLTENDVSPDEAGLQKLMEANCYHAAINLTHRLLKPFNQTAEDKPVRNTPFSIRLWYVRLALFVKLKQFQFAEKEIAAFGNFDKPDLYYEYYPDMHKGKRGSIVPFSFRLLSAELPQHLENPQLALDNLYYILNIIQKMIKNVQNGCAEDGSMVELTESRKAASLEVWQNREKRVLYSILNCVQSQKDYISAVSVAKVLIEKSSDKLPQLYSALGRIYLQLGDVKAGQECFTRALEESKQRPANFQTEEKINRALLAISQNNNEEAYKYYEEAFALSPDNAMLANNMAVCLLYMGRLKDSLSLLETTIHKNPKPSLHDGLLFNICTLYELESSRCSQKKLAMLELISTHVGDAFNVGCLKIQSLKA